jgi:hypothetical protein
MCAIIPNSEYQTAMRKPKANQKRNRAVAANLPLLPNIGIVLDVHFARLVLSLSTQLWGLLPYNFRMRIHPPVQTVQTGMRSLILLRFWVSGVPIEALAFQSMHDDLLHVPTFLDLMRVVNQTSDHSFFHMALLVLSIVEGLWLSKPNQPGRLEKQIPRGLTSTFPFIPWQLCARRKDAQSPGVRLAIVGSYIDPRACLDARVWVGGALKGCVDGNVMAVKAGDAGLYDIDEVLGLSS